VVNLPWDINIGIIEKFKPKMMAKITS